MSAEAVEPVAESHSQVKDGRLGRRGRIGCWEYATWSPTIELALKGLLVESELAMILEGKTALRPRIILWGRGPASTNKSDGETLSDGTPDPDAELTFQERKQKARDGVGAEPQIEVFFRIADHEDLGIFKFQTGSWSMAQDLARDNAENELADYVDASESGKVKAILKLEKVEFTAKNGPRAGQLVSYTKPVLQLTTGRVM